VYVTGQPENENGNPCAIAEYREVVRLRPNDAPAHFGLGVNLGLKANWDCEITEEREAIRLNPDSAYVHNSLGVALERKGQIQAALRPGGVLLMGEGSEEGFESLNDLRVR
jgi:Flp pilus assembly protein TadD